MLSAVLVVFSMFTSRSAKFGGRVCVLMILVFADAAFTVAKDGYIPSALHAGLALVTAVLLLVILLTGRKRLSTSS